MKAKQLVCLFLLIVILNNASAQTHRNDPDDAPAVPVGVAFKASTLGAGMDIAVGVHEKLNLRGGFNFLSFGKDYDRDGIQYDGTLKLRSGEVQVDWFPTGGNFHLTGGALVYNGNRLDARAFVPGGQGFELGGGAYASSQTDPVNGTGELTFQRVAPMVKWGWGNIAKRTGHFTFIFESGIAFHGSPRAKLALGGTACTTSFTFCRNAATDLTIQQDVRDEEDDLNRRASPWKVYPIITIGFAYRF